MAQPAFPQDIKKWTDKQDHIDDVFAGDINGAYAEIIAMQNYMKPFTDTGVADAYSATIPNITEYFDGLMITLKIANSNTGHSTLNINDLGAKSIKKEKDIDLAANDLKAGQYVTFVYDGTNFQMVSAVNGLVAHQEEDASTTVKGHVQLATNAEVTAGTETSKAVTPAGAKVEFDKKVNILDLQNLGYIAPAKNISSSVLDEITDNGFYSGSNLVNAPDAGYYYVEVIRHGVDNKYILQRITGVSGTNINKTFQRVKNNTAWTAWQIMKPAISRQITTTELATQIQIKSDGSDLKVIYSLKIDNLKSTDIIVLLAQAEITNPKTYNVGIGRQLLATASQSATTGSPIIGSPAVMQNITPDIHHDVIQAQAIDTGRTGTVYYNLIAWATYTSPGGSDMVTVESGYGGITAIVISQ